jgi:hypothetical protein
MGEQKFQNYEQYVEGTCLEFPFIENGVTGLGDLWDCRESKPLHLNLFESFNNSYGKSIKEHVKATPFSSKKFNSFHVKSTSDKLKTIDVQGEVSLDILSGFIKAGGSANLESKESSEKLFEKISFKLDMTTYTIELLPSAIKIVDKRVKRQIRENMITATHVVNKIIIGASVDATVTLTHNIKDDYKKISGISYKYVYIGIYIFIL